MELVGRVPVSQRAIRLAAAYILYIYAKEIFLNAWLNGGLRIYKE